MVFLSNGDEFPLDLSFSLFLSSPLFPLQGFLPWEALKGFLSKICIYGHDLYCFQCPHGKQCNGGDDKNEKES